MLALDPVSLSRLASLPIKARVIVEGAMSGLHRARLHGSSVEFAEHKEYSPGDEIRRIDWKAVGKLDRYYVKQFEQESQLTVYLLLDASGSMEFAGGGMRKLDYAALVLAALAYLVIHQQDKVGLEIFGDPAVQTRVPPRGRPRHLHDLLAVIDAATTTGGRGDQSPTSALEHIAESLRRTRALIVVASDLFDADDRTVATLRQLRAQGHDVTVVHTLDPHERTFPYQGLTQFEALEGAQRMVANPAAIRNQYLERFGAFLERTRRDLAAAGVDYHLASSDAPLDATLLEILIRRTELTRRGVR